MIIMEKMDLVTPVEKAFNLLSTLDLDFFDIYSTHSRSFNIEFFGKGFNARVISMLYSACQHL